MTRTGSEFLRDILAKDRQPEVWIRFPRQLGDVVFSLPFFFSLQRQWNALAAEAGSTLRWIAVGHDIGASLFGEADPA
ncbi:MAG TPA: hypothetical protein VN436_03595, partial [Holophaga sp.]|nr:hypothetical protein [Holophaga sp.]